MSRLEKKSIGIPEGVKIEVNKGNVTVAGPNGKLTQNFLDIIRIEVKDNKFKVFGDCSKKFIKAQVGLAFALIKNMIKGVTEGYVKRLEVIGVGFRVHLQGKTLNLQLGFSHPVIFPIPEGIKIETPKPTQISIQGIDKEKVGDVAARIRAIFPPEPYKGKGIKYEGEFIRRKLGKTATK